MKKLIACVFAVGALNSPAMAATLMGDFSVYTNGDTFISGGSYGDIASGSFQNANGSGGGNFKTRTTSDAASTANAKALSQAYSEMASTSTTTSAQWEPGKVTLTGNNSGTNVYSLDASQWSSIYSLTFAGPGDGAIINISGTDFGRYKSINYGNLDLSKVVFNFYDATSVNFNGMDIKGSVLAPNAHVNLPGGGIAGSVVADSFHSEGAVVGGAAFTGLTPGISAVPEPATWAMMIAGFGAIGMMMRRGKRRTVAVKGKLVTA